MTERSRDTQFLQSLTESSNLVPVAVSSPTGYAFYRPRPGQPDDADDGYPEITAVPDRETISKEMDTLLAQPPAGWCWCVPFDKVTARTEDGRFVILKTDRAERAYALQLTSEQRARGNARLAIGYCPFDRYKLDASLPPAPWSSADDQPPLCCDWLAHAVLVTEHVQLPSPLSFSTEAFFLDDDGESTPFTYCPRCGGEMRILITRRNNFFRSHR